MSATTATVSSKTVLDRHSEYQSICKELFVLFGKAKQSRIQCDGLGLTLPFPATAAGPALADVTFPLAGELSHITGPEDLIGVVKSLEALETALTTPVTVDGQQVVPIAALAKFAG